MPRSMPLKRRHRYQDLNGAFAALLMLMLLTDAVDMHSSGSTCVAHEAAVRLASGYLQAAGYRHL